MQSNHQTNKPYGFIYKTVLPDGRYYIRQHKIISHKTLDPTYFGSGIVIRDYLKSKGSTGVMREILEFGYSFDEMNLLENRYVTQDVVDDPKNINLDISGRSKFTRYPDVNRRIDETISKKRKEEPHLWKSKKKIRTSQPTNWKIISPESKEFVFLGYLDDFCAEKGISVNTMEKAIKEGWIPKRGICSGWQAFNLDTGKGTFRHTLNHGASHSKENNPYYKNKRNSK
jgi:hypothetical protein